MEISAWVLHAKVPQHNTLKKSVMTTTMNCLEWWYQYWMNQLWLLQWTAETRYRYQFHWSYDHTALYKLKHFHFLQPAGTKACSQKILKKSNTTKAMFILWQNFCGRKLHFPVVKPRTDSRWNRKPVSLVCPVGPAPALVPHTARVVPRPCCFNSNWSKHVAIRQLPVFS